MKNPVFKKTENKRGLYFQVGLVISLSLVLFAFNYSNEKIVLTDYEAESAVDWSVIPLVSVTTEEPKTEKKEQKTPSEKVNTDLHPEISDDKEPYDNGSDFSDTFVVQTFDPIEKPEDLNEDPVFWTSTMPEFPGGEKAMFAFIAKNIHYPELAIKSNCKGKVVVTFVVEKDGRLGEVKSMSDPGCGLAEEAERVVKNMPRWEPGHNNFRAVRVRINLPIRFELE
jgi:protein TonB